MPYESTSTKIQETEPCVAPDPKALGAFYTDAQIADFLVWWAIRRPDENVLDPSFGGGVFLRSACDRIVELGGNAGTQIYGVEIDEDVYSRIAPQLQQGFGVLKRHLIRNDFFSLHGAGAPTADVVVGNPPFIRYQRFAGEIRQKALARAAEQGLKLSELSSSWLPFLVHSIGLLKNDGRLAMVIPIEITHAAYARPILEHLAKAFSQVTFLTFRKKLFPELNEDTLLLLAEGKGAKEPARFHWRDLPHGGALEDLRLHDERGFRTRDLNPAFARGRMRLIEYFLPKKARALYEELKASSATKRLGDVADVGIGYVTGANEFFHLDDVAAKAWNISPEFLQAAVRRGRSLSGLLFTGKDWEEGLKTGETGYLLRIQHGQELTEGVRQYLKHGERRGVATGYKCRTRSPWYSVPHVYEPGAFLTYMSGTTPRLVANDAHVVAPNSLHILRFRMDMTNGRSLAALWQTSLSALSAEIEGHALGGGMLKLEPTEAENVLIPWPALRQSQLSEFAGVLDQLARRAHSIEDHANKEILQEQLGLSEGDCRLLAEAAETLRRRRLTRNAR